MRLNFQIWLVGLLSYRSDQKLHSGVLEKVLDGGHAFCLKYQE